LQIYERVTVTKANDLAVAGVVTFPLDPHDGAYRRREFRHGYGHTDSFGDRAR
jgi:hypothetical protein